MLRHLQKIAISVFGSFDGCSKIQKDESMKYLFISKGMVVFFFRNFIHKILFNNINM